MRTQELKPEARENAVNQTPLGLVLNLIGWYSGPSFVSNDFLMSSAQCMESQTYRAHAYYSATVNTRKSYMWTAD